MLHGAMKPLTKQNELRERVPPVPPTCLSPPPGMQPQTESLNNSSGHVWAFFLRILDTPRHRTEPRSFGRAGAEREGGSRGGELPPALAAHTLWFPI